MTKKTWVMLIVSVCLLAGTIVYLLCESQWPVRNLDSDGETIVAFGDSLVSGTGTTEGGDFVSVLSQRIGEPIVNLGKRGDTTATALTRIDDVLNQNPKLVIILLGGNDFLTGVPIDTSFSNLSALVTRIQDHGAAVLLLGVRGGLLRDTYNSRFEKFARDHQAAFVPNVLHGLIGNQEYMFDTIHPNDKGHILIADKVEPTLLVVLKTMSEKKSISI
jgi:acyl-CoA thioesterase I